ncbi:AfsR/SARP family transcriptional regulator [Actinomadura verrucosospora]|uniref:SARP family transcriptional regulator n=1 Tax=Actinomadura verrucosospora TaxID=46165 RepID=A0A7D3ZVD0_ACTVE|nr:AfsR/SARP family transcriptional regulator [Actinomadura verrucosospora]QKG19826.1 SARP family transcriptional regulator [Actinomadura verrucosospora]
MLRFTVLGPVEAAVPGRTLPALAPRHRALLAYLLLHAGSVLSAEQLIDAMWGPAGPETARAQVHAAVTAIRRVLKAADAEHLLVTRPAGYVLTPEPGGLDLAEFTGLVAAAEREPDEAARRLRAALDLWRGPALTGVNAGYVESARSRLEDRRLRALERLAELEIAADRHEELADGLAAELAAHPLRERLAAHLMTALHRAGRQADALAVGREYRERLAGEQGLDPGPVFAAVEEAVLRAAPAPPTPTPTPAPSPEPRHGTFLPYDVGDFAGRTEELDLIAQAARADDGAVRIVAIDGMAGAGKTALAVHAAHRLAERFPDGRLFVDLRAHTEGDEPADPARALEVLLRQVGVAADAIPPDLPGRVGAWRAALAGRRMLVVLDNAAGAGQVRPLLPGASASLVLITSRRRLPDLDAAVALSIDVLPRREAAGLFARIVGERAAAQPDAVDEVLLLCGFLPLAVRIAAARLRHRPRWDVAHLAGRLRDERRGLAELATAERGVGAAFALSYRQLDPDHRRLFRLLGLHPGRDIEPRAAAALAGLDPAEAEDLLEDLLDVHMLQQHEPGRYRFHDLLRRYARDTAATEPPEERHAALTRLLDHYLGTAGAAMDVLYPDSAHRRPRVEHAAEPAAAFRDADEALAWLTAERADLVLAAAYAADNGWPAHTGALATTLYRHLYDQALHDDARLLYGKALDAARRRRDPAAEGRALTDLGWVHRVQGDRELACDHFERALEACDTAGDQRGQARALIGLGGVHTGGTDHEAAWTAYLRARDLFRALDDRFGEAVATDSLGVVCERLDRLTEADALHREALALFRAIGSQGGEADALHNLGVARLRQGRVEEARDHHEAALDLYRRFGYRRGEAKALNGLAAAARDAGDAGASERLYRAAFELATELGDRQEQARARDGLGGDDRPGA